MTYCGGYNVTCTLLCEVAKLAAHEARAPGYYGDYFTKITHGIGIGAFILAGINSIAQDFMKGCQDRSEPNEKHRTFSKVVSVIGKVANAASILSFAVAFVNESGIFGAPSTQFSIDKTYNMWNDCGYSCDDNSTVMAPNPAYNLSRNVSNCIALSFCDEMAEYIYQNEWNKSPSTFAWRVSATSLTGLALSSALFSIDGCCMNSCEPKKPVFHPVSEQGSEDEEAAPLQPRRVASRVSKWQLFTTGAKILFVGGSIAALSILETRSIQWLKYNNAVNSPVQYVKGLFSSCYNNCTSI